MFFYGFDSDYIVRLIYCFYDNDDELNDDKYFLILILFTSKYNVICNVLFWLFLTYVSGITDFFTFSKNSISTE